MIEKNDPNPMSFYVVCLYDEDSPRFTKEIRKSNRATIITCSEYIVFDCRSMDNKRRVPMEEYIKKYKAQVMKALGQEIFMFMKKGRKKELKKLLDIMAENEYTNIIKSFLGEPIKVVHSPIKRKRELLKIISNNISTTNEQEQPMETINYEDEKIVI